MKAILVVDIPKEFENEKEFFVEGTLFYYIDNPYTNYRYAFNIDKTKLKPLPQKKEKLKGRGKDHCEYSLLDQLEYRKGFNDCIDEILGEEE
jgi:hypothetical protein